MKPTKHRFLAGSSALALVLAPATAQAVQYGPQAFVFDDGVTELGDGTTIASSDGTAGVFTGELVLTRDDTPNTHSSFRLPALEASSAGWTVSFEFAMSDGPDNGSPAEGFSFSYGAIPSFNESQPEPSAADAHGQSEEGWHSSVDHLSFEFDTKADAGEEAGFSISHSGGDIAADNRILLTDGQMVLSSVVLSWHPEEGASMSVDLGSGLAPVFANIATPGFSGDDAYSFAFSARTGAGTQTLSVDNVRITTIPPGFVVLPNPIISEFMADNGSTLEDEDCRHSDWIELFNATADPVNLEGWFLTDDPAELPKWRIPDLPLGPNERKVIFASGKDQTEGELHTDFSLDKEGEYVALVMPDGFTVVSAYSFGPQVTDTSYGTLGQAQTEGAFATPTPGAQNVGPQGAFIIERPTFSLDNQVITEPVTLELSTDVSGATIRYTTNGSEPTSNSPVYSSPLEISTTTRVTARLFAPGMEPGPVLDRTFVKLAPDILNFVSEVPIVIVDSFGRNIDAESSADSQNPRRPVHAIFIDIDPVAGRARVTDLPDFEGRGGMRVRGQTSAGFPKKQYSFETWDSEGNDKDVSIFGFPSESDWILHAPYSDKTLMRNKIVYDTSREIGYPASRTKFFELFYNANGGDVSVADYRGVYVFMEKIKRNDDRVKIKELEPCDSDSGSITGGYVFKKDKGSPPGNITVYSAREGHRLEIVEPDPPTSAQRGWLQRHIDQFESVLHNQGVFADPARGYRSYLDVKSFIDTHIWVEVHKNIDGYRLSSYFYKDRGRKIVASPVWDYNLSLGNANYLQGEFPNGWYYTQLAAHDYPWYARLFQDSEFVIEYWDRYFELREGILGTANMMDRINDYTLEIRRPALRNFANKWTNLLGQYTWPNASGYAERTTHQSEVNWMKSWLTNRLNWIDSQHTRPPSFAPEGGIVSPGTTLTISNPNAGGGTIYYTTDGTDPRLRGGSASSSAQVYSSPLALSTSQTIRSRVLSGGNWSPLQTEFFLVDGEPAGPANLAVSEIHYRPGPVGLTEVGRGFDERVDFEFVEIMNVGTADIDLTGVRFTEGIEFNFDLGGVSWLAPGERAVVVGNRDAFEMRYAAQLSGLRIAGEFTKNLSNDGETIVLSDAHGEDIRRFTYNDKAPWPEGADGSGPSLELINPLSNPDHNDPLNWRSSLQDDGTPGGSDGTQFVGDPDGDDDQNGISNFLQYALAPAGVEPALPRIAVETVVVDGIASDFMTLAYSRNLAADDVTYLPEISEDLVTWTEDPEGGFAVVSRVDEGDGTETITLRLNQPVAGADHLFGRLSVRGGSP